MRLLAVISLLLLVAGCGGGGTKNVARSAVPCLQKLGSYLHHEPRPVSFTSTTPSLPFADPASRTVPRQLLDWPKDFQEYGEISYPSSAKGANAVQIFIFGSDELPKRVRAEFGTAIGGRFAPPGVVTDRLGQTLLLWSSLPTARQRSGVHGCLQ